MLLINGSEVDVQNFVKQLIMKIRIINQYILSLIFLFLITSFFSCEKDENHRTCIENKIDQGEKEGSLNRVYSYTYDGHETYLFIHNGGDIFSILYDADCVEMCKLGGIAGYGDGNCNDFYDTATNKTLVWIMEGLNP